MIMNMREDRSEILQYDTPDNPVFFRNNTIPKEYDFDEEILHWHDEVEFIYVYEGSIWYQVNDEHIHMNKGEGIFVNSRQLHVIYSDRADTRLYCLIFHPTLLCASSHIAKTYIEPVINLKNVPYFKMSEQIAWQKETMDSIAGINTAYENDQGDLVIMQHLLHLWNSIYENVSKKENSVAMENTDLATVKAMLSFIQVHFAEKLSLQDICDAGNVGKTKASQLFSRYLNASPIDYLNQFRIEKSKEFLRNTKKSITEIALETGFPDSSYFSKMFRKKMCINPTYYRHILRKQMTQEGENDEL